MTNASKRLPRSWKCAAESTSDSGGTSARSTMTTTANDRVASNCPMITRMPYIVENQCGSNDIIQSTDENVAVRTYSTNPGPLRSRRRRPKVSAAVRSCACDQRLSPYARASQATKYMADRSTKNGTFKYGLLCCNRASAATASGRAQLYNSPRPKSNGTN